MKVVYDTREGVKMNSTLDFGTCEAILDEFEYLMNTVETMWDIDLKYFYRITDDNYIQLAQKHDDSELQIRAQYRLKYENLKENIIFIVKQSIEAYLPYEGFPRFESSKMFTEQEFNSIIQTMKDEKLAIIEQAKANETPLIVYLKEKKLNPRPTGNNPKSWSAKCPNSENHQIMIVTDKDEWGCGYCKRKGHLTELISWLQEIKNIKQQKKLTEFMIELNKEKAQKKEDTFEQSVKKTNLFKRNGIKVLTVIIELAIPKCLSILLFEYKDIREEKYRGRLYVSDDFLFFLSGMFFAVLFLEWIRRYKSGKDSYAVVRYIYIIVMTIVFILSIKYIGLIYEPRPRN